MRSPESPLIEDIKSCLHQIEDGTEFEQQLDGVYKSGKWRYDYWCFLRWWIFNFENWEINELFYKIRWVNKVTIKYHVTLDYETSWINNSEYHRRG